MKLSIEKRRSLRGYMFVSPFIVGALLFFVYPIITSLRLSVSKLDSVQGLQMHFVGFEQYKNAFMTDMNFVPYLWQSLLNMLRYTPLIVVLSLILAIMINRNFKLRGLFRVIFFLPFLLGTGYVMNQLLGQNIQGNSLDISRGLLVPEQITNTFGPMVSGAISTYLSIITMVLWQSGVQILLYLSGLQSISPSLYESARCDGATEWEIFWKITLPMLSPIILLTIVFTIVVSFTDMTNPVIMYIYTTTFKTPPQFEFGAAMGWIYFLIVFVIIGLIFLIMSRFIKNVSGAR